MSTSQCLWSQPSTKLGTRINSEQRVVSELTEPELPENGNNGASRNRTAAAVRFDGLLMMLAICTAERKRMKP